MTWITLRSLQARIIHEHFCCNRGDGNQNPMRYSFFAPRSCKGRSTSQARWRRTWTRSDRRPGRRARHSVGQHPASLTGSALEPASPRRSVSPPRGFRAPVSAPHPSLPHTMGEGRVGGRRNVMNNAGWGQSAHDGYGDLSWTCHEGRLWKESARGARYPDSHVAYE